MSEMIPSVRRRLELPPYVTSGSLRAAFRHKQTGSPVLIRVLSAEFSPSPRKRIDIARTCNDSSQRFRLSWKWPFELLISTILICNLFAYRFLAQVTLLTQYRVYERSRLKRGQSTDSRERARSSKACTCIAALLSRLSELMIGRSSHLFMIAFYSPSLAPVINLTRAFLSVSFHSIKRGKSASEIQTADQLLLTYEMTCANPLLSFLTFGLRLNGDIFETLPN